MFSNSTITIIEVAHDTNQVHLNMANEWIDIKELLPDDSKSVIVKYKSGRTCVRKVKCIFERPWLMIHNNQDTTDFRANRIITHYKEIEED